eukprot:CAMPEP_0172511546 /NCGR_PEP_ID=MMETSP1066-20121228/237289_1 /TAXON_ID=671091 /ORGANISM="Coscinodiscus wailesii, Strain CCMP2513" /LENGTH=966 /DNA_ID=CAMNT_0013290969 /DNA_START=207 /DNA_END=3107 /DNA_ORIENTATION=-
MVKETDYLLGRNESFDAEKDGVGNGHHHVIDVPRPAPQSRKTDERNVNSSSNDKQDVNAVLALIYGLINTIMTVPCMYGYAAVIFSNDAFHPHIDALSKLVLFSSFIHQVCFSIFSSLSFSIGQVQDAGLIFLSSMSNTIAEIITAKAMAVPDEEGRMSDAEINRDIVSTTVVILGLGTATLGLLLYVMGKCNLADVVSFLPLPVVGGYLAFIGYFCLEAGVGLCINENIMELKDWAHLKEGNNLLLATPGVLSGILMTWVSRKSKSDAALPIVMVVVPVLFYVILFVCGLSFEDARDGGWIGEESPPVSFMDVIRLVDFERVHWSLVTDVLGTWVGMVFVVAFSSCLDVAAISTDMGEPLDTNQELRTVGISNFFSGLLGGFTGSYIFSQTIFTYRSGLWTRWIGIIVALSELGVFFMSVNVLEVTPLFFLGSTLIFIAVDLIFEWLIEVRHKLLFSEYFVLLFTFFAIQVFNIQSGIVIGIVVAGVDYIVSTAQTTSIHTVKRRSRAVWNHDEWRILQRTAYSNINPKIVSFELKGNVFFGSSLKLLTQMNDRIGLNTLSSQPEEIENLKALIASPRHVKSKFQSDRHVKNNFRSPRLPTRNLMTHDDSTSSSVISNSSSQRKSYNKMTETPYFVTLDMGEMTNLDASAALGTFLQFAKMCGKRRIIVCAAGANRRVCWTLRSHDVAYSDKEFQEVHDALCSSVDGTLLGDGNDAKIMLFRGHNEALEFCETALLHKLEYSMKKNIGIKRNLSAGSLSARGLMSSGLIEDEVGVLAAPARPISSILNQYIKLTPSDLVMLDNVLGTDVNASNKYYYKMTCKAGQTIFKQGEPATAFYITLKGSVTTYIDHNENDGASPSPNILTGAGIVRVASVLPEKSSSHHHVSSKNLNVTLHLGSIFGYCDFILDHHTEITARALEDDTILACFTRDHLDRLKEESLTTLWLLEKVLLQVSVRELYNANGP